MSTIGLVPPRTLTLFVKKIPVLLLDGAVPARVGKDTDTTTYKSGDQPLPVFKGSLVQVYGYQLADDERPVRLPEPVKLVLPGEPLPTEPDPAGRRNRAQKMFPPDRFLRWPASLDAQTLLFDIDEASVAEGLGLAPPEGFDLPADGAGFTLRGADGRLYYVPDSLGSFEIVDESERGSLMLAPGMDRDDLRVREVIDDGAGGAIQARAMLQSRAMLQNRAMLQSRAMLQNRAMLQSRAMMQNRAMLQSRAMMQNRAMMQARAMMQTHLHDDGHHNKDED